MLLAAFGLPVADAHTSLTQHLISPSGAAATNGTDTRIANTSLAALPVVQRRWPRLKLHRSSDSCPPSSSGNVILGPQPYAPSAAPATRSPPGPRRGLRNTAAARRFGRLETIPITLHRRNPESARGSDVCLSP
ncbi:uncharacterized protein K452DRAFT_55067 [Aplosporella prunicola CBS 121167]|uniref:Uncharacterized protein n=1 Tax=Aplosporella prunicola CBS 121167 TaxID=1176127 RepID=A0A6A6B844_9PEZI|nr:uncharacterized protein K452DRAFT_55067 [Aplosporella prunicola CBS 121167]KAF2140382.1 hypothetical protein K452DRAFT_55067 [Aplosporella prunicola CBS 121167]